MGIIRAKSVSIKRRFQEMSAEIPLSYSNQEQQSGELRRNYDFYVTLSEPNVTLCISCLYIHKCAAWNAFHKLDSMNK